MYSFPLQELIDMFSMEVLTEKADIARVNVTRPEINRPGLQLSGFFDYYDEERIQIIGRLEYTYLEKMAPAHRRKIWRRMCRNNFPCIVICRDMEPFPHMIGDADEMNRPVLRYEGSTTEFIGEVLGWLKVQLAPREIIHGVLVDVYGEGVLIIGESGIGKSETALELIKRGHRLVADDAVEIKRVSNKTLVGSCPEVIRYFIELRGIGIIDVRQMFGVQSIMATMAVDLVIKLEIWDQIKEYDRLGMVEEHMNILGNNVVCHTIPVRPGRNLAVICESAAINHRQKKMGYNAAQVLNQRVTANIDREKQSQALLAEEEGGAPARG